MENWDRMNEKSLFYDYLAIVFQRVTEMTINWT